MMWAWLGEAHDGPAKSASPARLLVRASWAIRPCRQWAAFLLPATSKRSLLISDCGIKGMRRRTSAMKLSKSEVTPCNARARKALIGSSSSSAQFTWHFPPFETFWQFSFSSFSPGKYSFNKANTEAKTAGDPSCKMTSQSLAVAAKGQECEAKVKKCSEMSTSKGTSKSSKRLSISLGSSRCTKTSRTAASSRKPARSRSW
mmetsp:Transcript_30586/g.77252  ORF Transcript_30586/g.77252 Transcript_30586/m.77252 type:complete len:202 (-) Transcript_30586:240-845(-)